MKNFVKVNLDNIISHIKYLEVLNKDIKDIITIAKNQEFMKEYMNYLDSGNEDILRTFNFLVTTYLIDEKIKKKDKEYKIELLNTYIQKNREYILKIKDLLNCSDSFAIDMSIFVSPLWKDEYTHNIEKRIYRFIAKMYKIHTIDNNSDDLKSPITVMKILEFIKFVFGKIKYFDEVLFYLLIELKDKVINFDSRQIAIWNMITNMVIDALEKLPEKRLYNVLERYVMHIQDDSEKNYQRRIEILNNVALIDYPNLSKVCSQIKEVYADTIF
ncbi:hypothetical protein DLH72_04615 [Candidatus Gracilibacteria bacterium]|nr:MAG: hypothetical protein DLH72_04615 [Candidatus Gracilibacteria bacterium]